jgi:hypothetical protein
VSALARYPQDSAQERRAAMLDAGFLRRLKTMPLHLAKIEQVAHWRMYHDGHELETCWRCRAVDRRIMALVVKVPR